MPTPSPATPASEDRIDLSSPSSVDEWSTKLDVSEDQLREAVGAVGNRASDVELHLKGSRSTTNAERVDEAGAAPPATPPTAR
jgi:hypothetical protein